MINIPIQQSVVAKKELSKEQIFERGFKHINLDNICDAMEHGQLVAPAIVSYILGPNVYRYLGEELQETLIHNVQVIIYKHKLTLSILGNNS